MRRQLIPLALFAVLAVGATAYAETPTAHLIIKDRVFTVQELTLPADTQVKLVVENQDRIPAEFESYDLSREVVVPGRSSIVVYIAPLAPGRYNFFNDFNHAAQGWVVVNAPAESKTGGRK
ncbi:MAG: cupredoxin domain-containing protein [Gammaproteobacteria bacterium]|nr:cupredoxin domain-containing protein [Gammaproteobacteria bacterium]MDE2023197.1 cupredoxin domain-containing protein [Gammaproteobacteria bacterium]MDE2273245.1 cupredoxin domain-containing protein [Gammaproteobacteria bacterium]